MRFALALGVCLMPVLFLEDPARAAFPGQNGKIAFYDNDGLSNSGIFVMNSDGTGVARVAEGQFGDPKWSPDGARFAVSGTSGGSSDIWVFNADGTGADADHVRSGRGDRSGLVTRWLAIGRSPATVMATSRSTRSASMAPERNG